MVTVFLALGSNVGNSRQYIKKATELIGSSVRNISSAPIYTSKAVGYEDQPDFLNTALRGETDLEPEELLAFVKKVEQEVGRIYRFRWGPREIDIDIIFYGDSTLHSENLVIPHPRFRERDFVLRPICDIDPLYIDPVTKLSVKTLLEKISGNKQSIKQI